MNAPIGVIDSGVGGLTVVRELRKYLPNEPIIYIGDDARCPYGPRTADEVLQFTMEMVSSLAELGVKMLVIACNTATAVALEKVRSQFSFPIIGVIQPGARAAVKASVTGEIAVLGTLGTVKSGAYDQAIHYLEPEAAVHSLACPEFVPIVESGEYRSSAAKKVVDQALQPLHASSFDTVILGCTHFPLLQEHIEEHFHGQKHIISSAVETVIDVERILREQQIVSAGAELPVFYTTGSIEKFRSIVEDWLCIPQPDVRSITF
ncbi:MULTISPECIES: glutamate racemase [Sporosarcina]|uniref:glutamate racemase n=1 Tax=Sporosarcina TaxID=1569 RepID=UPI00129A8411|nr:MULTISPECIES: glutamate racemase [Sporosarcina]GKV66403.1 glutamate racemase [Sporosarcina sp. NCCP-2331]GLB56732.1 glutamate racemase [Sporosarcina sp. NCCP-2378]